LIGPFDKIKLEVAIMEVIELPLKLVKIHQIKKDWIKNAHVNGLISSINNQGLLSPLIVIKSGETYEVLSGAHRLTALQSLGYDSAPCVVADEKEEPMQLILQLDCLQRQTNALQEGQALKSLLELGYSQEQVSVIVGKSSSWVQHRLALVVQLVKSLQDEVARGYLSAKKAQDIARLPVTIQKRFAFLVHNLNLSAREVEKLVAIYNNPKTTDQLKQCILTTPKLALQPINKGKIKRGIDPQLRAIYNVMDETKEKLEGIEIILTERQLTLDEQKQLKGKFQEVYVILGQLQSIVSRQGIQGLKEIRGNSKSQPEQHGHSGILPDEQDIPGHFVQV